MWSKVKDSKKACKKVQIVPTIIYKAVKHCGAVLETELYKEVFRNMIV